MCITGQPLIPMGESVACYSSNNCADGTANAFGDAINTNAGSDLNRCCFDGNINTPRANPGMLSFRLNPDAGFCKTCDGKHIRSYILYEV